MAAVPVADLLRQVPAWTGRAVDWERMQGGLSHHIYRVTVDDASFVLRVLDPAVSEAGLGIAPADEIENTVRAARSGVGAEVLEVLPDVPAIVLSYLPGRTLGQNDVRDETIIPTIAAACRRLHAGPHFVSEFDIFAKRDQLLDICARHDLPLPAGYSERDADMDRLR